MWLGGDRSGPPTGGVRLDEVGDEVAQVRLGGDHASRRHRVGKLVQVAPHSGDDLGSALGQSCPVPVRAMGASVKVFPIGGRHSDRVHGAHRDVPTSTWASMASAALRYSSASQSAPRCRYSCVAAMER